MFQLYFDGYCSGHGDNRNNNYNNNYFAEFILLWESFNIQNCYRQMLTASSWPSAGWNFPCEENSVFLTSRIQIERRPNIIEQKLRERRPHEDRHSAKKLKAISIKYNYHDESYASQSMQV